MNNLLITIAIPTIIALGSFTIAFFTYRNTVSTDSVQIMQAAITEQSKQIKDLQLQMTEMQIKYEGMATLVKSALIEYFGDHSDVARALLTKI